MLEIGTLVDGKYRILDVVGHGGMSVVYLARNERANKTWAIKEVRKTGTEDLEVKQNSLIAETEMLKKLSHKYLPTIVDVIETDETYLVVMDYIEGKDLGKILKESGAQDQEKVIEWAKELCDVLGYLHTRTPPIIYRDLKPANIMLKPDGKIILIDFGTAREIKVKDANDTVSLGTRGYAAPEQFGANAKTDARTDIYCLGATIYHLVTNHNPATEPYVMEPIRQRIPTLSGGLEKIILKCTQPRPQDRYQSCAEVMYALENYEREDEDHKRKQKKKLAGFIASIVMMFVCLGVTIFGYSSAEKVKASNYDLQILMADDVSLDKETRIKYYMNAIEVDPTETTAYNSMVELFLSSNEDNGRLTEDEIVYFSNLKVGLDVMDNGIYQRTIQPFEELKSNPSNYAEVCYNIGMAYWYDYATEASRKIEAIGWFKDVIEYGNENDENYSYSLAKIYYEIGSCKKAIKDTNRIPEKNDGYEELWTIIQGLQTSCAELDDDEAKVLGWEEIRYEIDYESTNLANLVGVTQTEFNNMLDAIKSDAEALNATTKYTEIKDRIKTLNEGIETTSEKIDQLFKLMTPAENEG
ncbi:MAG: protein kinase [Acutalibacteraceae bacterium]